MQGVAVVRPSIRIAMVAGEASGDALGAALIESIRGKIPDAQFFGVAGPRMRLAGCEAWHESEELSVMGLAEVLPHLLRLLKLRRGLGRALKAIRPDVFVGIDSSDFNLPLARMLRGEGIPTVQYVSPQVWAWRQSRVHSVRDAFDRVLCLLPFECDFYARHSVPASFVGHPMADEIPDRSDLVKARLELGIAAGRPTIALLPGSRRSEVARLARPFMETAAWLEARVEGLQTVVAIANERLSSDFNRAVAGVSMINEPMLVTGRARAVLTASDAVLTASGTAALETMLVKRLMVIAYKMSPVSYFIVRRMGIAKLPFYTLPNLLARRRVVEEFVQGQVTADILGPAMQACLTGAGLDPQWEETFDRIHSQLRGGGSQAAAAAVLEVAGVATA